MIRRPGPACDDPIASDLARLRADPPFRIDVADRVMARIASLPPPSRRESRAMHVLAAAAAAGAVLLAVGAGTLSRTVALRTAVAEAVVAGWELVAGTVRVARPLFGIVKKFGATSWTIGDAAIGSAAAVAARPEAPIAASLCVFAALATAAYLVTRDLRGPIATKEPRP